MTVVGGGELFTGNTAVVTSAVIEGKASTGGLLKNWIFSYLGNFVGCVQHTAVSIHSVGTSYMHKYPRLDRVLSACDEGMLYSCVAGLPVLCLLSSSRGLALNGHRFWSVHCCT